MAAALFVICSLSLRALSMPFDIHLSSLLFHLCSLLFALCTKPIPNIQEKIQKMIAKYRAETINIEDVEYEEADLEEETLFNDDEERNDYNHFVM